MRSLISILDFTAEELDRLIDTAMDIIENPEEYSQKCRGKKLATLFFEPSTRTRLSFEAAMYELGGNVIGFSEADIIAMRHPMEGAPLVASRNASIPVINAGDGGHNHPTQTLADILTIYREKGRLNDLTIGMCGDLKYGRTVHSLIEAMSERKGIKIVLISPDELRLPGYIKKDVMDKKGMEYEEIGSLEQALPGLDVLYMTRVQRERFDSLEEYERLKDSYILTPEKLAHADEKMAILHPLPRVNEISVAVDDDPRACYFRQALNGKYMRMALILKLLSEAEKNPRPAKAAEEVVIAGGDMCCKNSKCITRTEQELKQMFKAAGGGAYRCVYCEQKVDRG